jgi:thiol-disulfide isomerase/thioredoxin
MKKTTSSAVAALLLCTSTLLAQAPAKSVLHDAAAKYRAAKRFHIAWETKITTSSRLSSGWSKQMYVVAADGPKYHWEADGSSIRGVRISDGASDWFYRPAAHEYSVQSSNRNNSPSQARGTAVGTTESWVKSAMYSLLHLDDDVDAAELVREEVLSLGNTKVECIVVRAKRFFSVREGVESSRDNTYWIDKSTGSVRKALLISSGPMSTGDDSDDITRTVETTYTSVDLNSADPALFLFKPPANAYLIDDSRVPPAPPVAVGASAPALRVKDRNGDLFDLFENKGKVVLVQFWASWCGACSEEMNAIAQLPRSYSEKGLVIVSVDEDEEPERGDRYFSSQNHGWKNYHDTGEAYRRAWGLSAYPTLAVVDRNGAVVWTTTGISADFEQNLRLQLARPELGLVQ